MLSFQPLAFAQYEKIKAAFGENPYRTCDYTVGTTYLWRRYFTTAVCEVEGAIVFCARYLDGAPMYTVPVGGDTKAALQALSGQEDLRFCFVPQAALSDLLAVFPTARVQEEPHWADYLYDREAFVRLSGKKYHGKRNFVNRFQKEYREAALVPVTEGNRTAALDFVKRQYAAFGNKNDMAAAEQDAILELLSAKALWGLDGALLTVADDVVGVTVGEKVGDTLYVHIEKADTAYVGAYPMLATAFAARYPDARYINREEDMGDEDLARSKESWHPVEKLPKYTVLVK